MNKHTRFILFLFALTINNSAMAAERWQIVVLPDPSFQSSTDIKEVHTVLSQRLSSMMTSADFDVISPQSLGLPDCFKQDCSALSDANIKDLAKSSGKEVNLALFYQIRISQQEGNAVTTRQFSLGGRMLDLESSAQLDSFNTDGRFIELQDSCKNSCFNNWMSDNSALLAQDLGAVLSEKLEYLERRFRYTLNLNAFTPSEIKRIDEYLKTLSSYVADKLIQDSNAQQQWLHSIADRKIMYVSTQSGSALRSEIENFIDQQGIPIDVTYSMQDRSLNLQRQNMPYQNAYIGAALAFILAMFLLYFIQQQQKHQRVLSKLASASQAQQWLEYFKVAHSPLVPRKKSWFEDEKHWLAQIQQAKAISEQAWLLADQHDYEGAQEKIEQALALNPDNQEAGELKQHIVDYKRGYERLQVAQSEIQSHPNDALSLLQEAKALNPRLSTKIASLAQTCERLINAGLANTALNDAKAAIAQGRIYKACSIIDKTLLHIGNDAEFVNAQGELENLRASINIDEPSLSGALNGTGALSGYHFFTAKQIHLGRTLGDATTSIQISYKRISRSGQQTQISRQDGQYFIEDMGSKNGTYYQNKALSSGAKMQCQHKQGIVLGGKGTAGTNAICQLDTLHTLQLSGADEAQTSNNTNKDIGNLVLKLSSSVFKFIDDTNIDQAWPKLEEEINKRWVLMDSTLPLGTDSNGDLVVVTNSSDTIKALLTCGQDGTFAIEPVIDAKNSANKPSELLVNQQTMYASVPLRADMKMTIAGHRVQFEKRI